MNNDSARPGEEQVLLDFAVEPTHDRPTLERYLAEYPQHTQALIDCSIEFIMEIGREVDAAVPDDAVVDQAWAMFEAARPPAADDAPQGVPAVNPFARIGPTEFQGLAARMKLNRLFMGRVRDRAIVASTYPQRFIERLAYELETAPQVLLNYLRVQPTMAGGLSFRANVKPEVAQQMSFEAAIESSQLKSEQKEALQALRD